MRTRSADSINLLAPVLSAARWALLVALSPAIVAAQSQSSASSSQSHPGTGWIFELHLGSVPGELPSKPRTSQLPAAGPGFQDILGNPSRRVPSWYFGDGAQLANQVVSQTGDPVQIVPLDPVLTSPSASRQSAANFGVRIGHTITRRVLLTLSYDQMNNQIGFTNDALAAIASTNASYQPFWNALLTRPTSANVKSSSTLTMTDNVANTERLFSIAAEIRVLTFRGWTPYVAVGGGLAWPDSAGPTVTLVGNYQFNFVNPGFPNNGVLFNETDQVQVQIQAQPAGFGILGFGVERDLAAHLGVRAELRTFLRANDLRTRIAAQPVAVIPAAPPFAVVRRGADPSLQISANPGGPTSLSLQGVDHFTSFEGTGNLPSFSVGVFVRF